MKWIKCEDRLPEIIKLDNREYRDDPLGYSRWVVVFINSCTWNRAFLRMDCNKKNEWITMEVFNYPTIRELTHWADITEPEEVK